MALDFPASPTMGETFGRWYWDGEKWLVVASGTENSLPVGAIVAWGGTTAPVGFLVCDGSVTFRSLYPELFEAIGETWGAGDGSTTFGLPNLTGRVPVGLQSGDAQFGTIGNLVGAQTHTLTEAEMPRHNHIVQLKGTLGADKYLYGDYQGGAGETHKNPSSIADMTGQAFSNPALALAKGSDSPHNNIQPSSVVLWIIKAVPSGAPGESPVAKDLFQSHAERDAYFAAPGNAPTLGQRCYVRLCEFMWWGTSWRAVPFVHGATTVMPPAAGNQYSWSYGFTYESVQSGLVVVSNMGGTGLVQMGDPAGYDNRSELQFFTYNAVPSTWRFECMVSGFLDGYSS